MAAITVIVPVYQAEKYLQKCVESILCQSFSDFVLILVDDGSADASGSICDAYALSDTRVKVLHKKNGGVSSARNAGLEKCESQYVTFCDSDDYWAPNWLESLYNAIASTDADVVSAGILSVTEEGTVLRHSDYESGSFLIHNESERTDFLVHLMLRLGWAVYTRLFKTDIIQKNRIRFCESCENYAEDLCFVLEYSLYCERIEACGFQGYYYVQHQESMMANSMGVIKLNAANEVSKQFGKRYLSGPGMEKRREIFPVIHYLIFSPEYRKISLNEEKLLRADIREIQDYRWYRLWSLKAFTSTGIFYRTVGKQVARDAVWKAALCICHLWGPYELYRKGKALAYSLRRSFAQPTTKPHIKR